MANAKNTKSNKSATRQTSAKAKTSKANKPVETVETVETVIEQTDAPALETRGDVTDVPEVKTEQVCTVHGGEALPLNADNFSPMQSGGFRTICKPCQVVKSKEWTDKRADLRKEQAEAVRFTNAGIPTQKPSARDWKVGDPLMTIEHTIMPDGTIQLGKVKGGQYFPSRDAREVFGELQAQRKADRDARKAELESANELAKAERLAERETKRAEREKLAEQAKAEAEKVRAEKKAERERLAAEKAATAKAEREQKALAKAAERAQNALVKAEEVKAAKATKQAERDRLAAEKAVKAAELAEQKRMDAIAASQQKTLNALKGKTATANA